MRLAIIAVPLLLALFNPAQAGTLIDLSAEASRPAANDLLRASLYAEADGDNPAEPARAVNREIGKALEALRAYPAVSAKSGQQGAYPLYDQNQKLKGWRARAELLLETTDPAAAAELLGKLQAMRLALGHLNLSPSPATRAAAEDDSLRAAIGAFRARAGLIAEQFGKPWTIRQLTVQQQGAQPLPVARQARPLMAAMEAAPIPLEAGESQVTTHVGGQIELAD